MDTYLGKHNNRRSGLGHVHDELGAVIIGRPGDIQRSPLLSDGPFISKETSPVEMLVFLEQILV